MRIGYPASSVKHPFSDIVPDLSSLSLISLKFSSESKIFLDCIVSHIERPYNAGWYMVRRGTETSCKSVDVSNFHLRQAAAVIAFFCCVIILIIRLSNWYGEGKREKKKLSRLCCMLYLSNICESTVKCRKQRYYNVWRVIYCWSN